MKWLFPLAVLMIPLMLVPLALAFLTSRFYRKAGLSEAIIRTGGAGAQAVIGRGIWVIPAIHQFELLDLSLKRIEVALEDASEHRSVATRDGVHAHLKADFYVRVSPTHEDVLNVAQAIGCQAMSENTALSELLAPKFATAVQRVARALTFDEIHRDPDAFMGKAIAEIGLDLNGLVVDDGVVEYFARA